MLRKVIAWALVGAWAGAIFGLSAVPGSNLPGGYAFQAHFTEYLVLAALLYAALRVDLSPKTAWLVAIVLASAYGVTDEIHQAFVPLRTPDALDWLVDTFGALAGASLAVAAERLLSRRRSAPDDPKGQDQ